MMKRILLVLALITTASALSSEQHNKNPNILLVLLDDAGFMDFSAFGSDSQTPNIDSLGQAGVMLTRYYTSPLCGPSRAALMTGQSAHQVGMGTLTEVLTDEMRELPAYSMVWHSDQKTIASRLSAAGYQTFVSGKWGIGEIGANLPHRFGFDRSFVLDSTGSSNYRAKSYLPHYLEVEWYEDGERITLPGDFYSSKHIVDKMMQFIEEGDNQKPFFGYLAFQAIHMPVQVPLEYIDRYNGVFKRGWDVMRQERLHKAINLGLVPATTKLSDGAYNHREWDSLSNEEKAYWARVMQVNAGMMEAADHQLGRLLAYLSSSGRLENTLVIVTSDNGPEYNTLGKTSGPGVRAFEKFWMSIEGWDVDYNNLGQQGSLAAIGHEWASVSAAPFHLFKFNASEGGMRVPMVISGPRVANQGFIDARAQVADITPTLLDFANVNFDSSEFYGRSMKPLLLGQKDFVYGDQDSFIFEVSGTAALYRGDWKLTKTPTPYGDDDWHLYAISTDPGETEDLAELHPEIYQELIQEYEKYADDVGIFDLTAGDSARKQLVKNALKGTVKNYPYLVIGLGLLCVLFISILLFVVFYTIKRWRKVRHTKKHSLVAER